MGPLELRWVHVLAMTAAVVPVSGVSSCPQGIFSENQVSVSSCGALKAATASGRQLLRSPNKRLLDWQVPVACVEGAGLKCGYHHLHGTKLVAVFTQGGHIQVGWYMHTAPLQLSLNVMSGKESPVALRWAISSLSPSFDSFNHLKGSHKQ